MSSAQGAGAPAHVVIAGGGFAALETALALRALAGKRVRLSFVSPERVLRYRPAATLEAFDGSPPRTYGLEAIAEELGAQHHLARLEAVASQPGWVRLSNGERLDYDALVVAIGARAVASIAGARTFRDQRDLPAFRRMLVDLEVRRQSRVVFAVPAGASWPLPLYELALLTAGHVARRQLDVEVTLVTPERDPLGIFGPTAARIVGELLEEQGVHFHGESLPLAVRRDGALELAAEAAVPADFVLTIPQLAGHRIAGLPARWWGFVPTDRRGRVEGLENVFAAGDMTAFPVKQGGLAAQQADRIAHAIAAGLGVPVKEPDERNVLQARLLGGPAPLLLRTELDWHGQPTADAIEPRRAPGAEDWSKVLGRYLTPYLEQREPLAA